MAHTILVVEDEAPIREMLVFALKQAGFAVDEVASVPAAIQRAADRRPDLILLDWMLPGGSGIELARRWKREESTFDIPIIMLTARGAEDEKIRGLDAGADDYMTKPFSPKELVARIKAVLRRHGKMPGSGSLQAGAMVLDPDAHRVLVNGVAIEIGPTEFRLLQFFMAHPDRVYTRGQLLDRVWGANVYIEERTIDVHIRRLRKSLEATQFDACVQTVRGAGYRFTAQV